MSWPEMPGCLLRLRYAQVSADSADLDELPDWSPLTGQKGVLKPSIRELVVYDPQGAKIVVELDTVQVEVDADGWLCKRTGEGVLIPLRVAPTDDPLMTAQGWTYTLTLGTRSIGPISAPSSGVVELADYVTAPATDATKAWVERIPELIELLTGAGVAPEAIAAAVADYLAANPIEGVTVADVLAEIAAHEGEADPHPQYVTESELPDVSDVVREGDTRLTDARTPTVHGHTAAEVEGLGDALAGKADTDHDHAISDVTGLQTALDGKQEAGSYADATHDHDGTYAAALGWLPVTYQPRPDNTATTTWGRDEPALVNGLPVVGWTERPKTEAEQAAEAEQNARLDDLSARVARIEAHLWPADPVPEPDAPIDAPTWGDYGGVWPNGRLLSDGGTVWRNVSGVPLTTPPTGFPGEPSQWGRLFVEITTADPDPDPDDPWPQWRGEWAADATYVPGDHVTRDGVVYRCIVAHGPEYQGTWGPPATGVWIPA